MSDIANNEVTIINRKSNIMIQWFLVVIVLILFILITFPLVFYNFIINIYFYIIAGVFSFFIVIGVFFSAKSITINNEQITIHTLSGRTRIFPFIQHPFFIIRKNHIHIPRKWRIGLWTAYYGFSCVPKSIQHSDLISKMKKIPKMHNYITIKNGVIIFSPYEWSEFEKMIDDSIIDYSRKES